MKSPSLSAEMKEANLEWQSVAIIQEGEQGKCATGSALGATSFSLPCHPHAISSGHQRYAAGNHGHSVRAVGLDARP
jgi:hypothetical protein